MEPHKKWFEGRFGQSRPGEESDLSRLEGGQGEMAKAKAGLERIWDQQGERWMKEKEEIKRRSTQAAEEWMIELREKERAIEALEREKMRILCLHGQEKKGWKMEKERLALTWEWERTNSEIEKMQSEKDRWPIEKRDMVERMKEAYIKLYQMQTALRFGEQEQPQKETKTAQRVRAKLEKKKRKEREMLEKNKVKELLRARKAESKEEVRKNKERVKAHMGEVTRNYNCHDLRQSRLFSLFGLRSAVDVTSFLAIAAPFFMYPFVLTCSLHTWFSFPIQSTCMYSSVPHRVFV
ncbi:golgin subfamily A member 6-like protein 2 [Oncorhynchus tshawytscha]|uniref:golgin subfamily A member 6-like protein 2 n=1 Tax=Oncorhynchus tshawytscha TaxID=74940 RepID=UPI001C3D45CD|nr:golgin subfamily A member 6-like protein 2 [Oncorhynchus tshawytscha]